jgi:hypothetical protein
MASLVTAKIEFQGFLDEHDYLWGDPWDNADVLGALSNVTHLELRGEAVQVTSIRLFFHYPILLIFLNVLFHILIY